MTRVAIDVLLVVAVLGTWLGCAGFARLRSVLDRMHCVAFVNTVSGAAVAAAAFVSDGASVRALKVLLVVAVSLLGGAALSHATGRALRERAAAPGKGMRE